MLALKPKLKKLSTNVEKSVIIGKNFVLDSHITIKQEDQQP